MVDIEALARQATRQLRGHVTQSQVREVIATALIAAVNQTVVEAEAIVSSRLVLEIAAESEADDSYPTNRGRRRVLPQWLRNMLSRNAADIRRRLAELRPPSRAEASADRL